MASRAWPISKENKCQEQRVIEIQQFWRTKCSLSTSSSSRSHIMELGGDSEDQRNDFWSEDLTIFWFLRKCHNEANKKCCKKSINNELKGGDKKLVRVV